MKKHDSKKQDSKKFPLSTLVISVLVLAFAIAAIIFVKKRGAATKPAASSNNGQQASRLLKDKAKRGGGKFIGSVDYDKASMKDSLEKLIADSESIVIAKVERNVSKLSEAGDSAITSYQVVVEDVLKGQFQRGYTLAVSLPGGKVGFEDGSTAETQALWFKRMLNNKRYILFLEKSNGADGFLTTGGPQGVFEIPGDGTVVSNSSLRDDPIRQHDKAKVKDFIKKLEQATGKKDNNGKKK